MSSETVYMICGKKLVLPATPEVLEFNWEKKTEHGKGSAKGRKGSDASDHAPKVPKPVKKRFRRKKIPKT
ncbi:MAG: hypothetical protein ACMUHU_07515 [Thermoplasmatota archaeon]